MDKQVCLFDDCGRHREGRGYCKGHYSQLMRGQQIRKLSQDKTLADRFWEKVSRTDGCWNWTGTISNQYGSLKVNGKDLRAHRISYEINIGPIPEGMLIDHKCHNRLCVNPTHLQLATFKQNAENLIHQRMNNTSGYRGVNWVKRLGKWSAEVTHRGHKHHLGLFTSPEDAHKVAETKRLELFTHNEIDKAYADKHARTTKNGDNK